MSDWLGGEIEDARMKLRRAEDALQAYAGTSGLIFTNSKRDGGETNIATEKLQQLQEALSAAIADRITKQSNYELAQHSPPDALPDVVNDDNLRAEAAAVNTVRGQVADLGARFTPEYGKLKSAQAQSSALEVAFEHDRASVIEKVKNDYLEAMSREKLLSRAYDVQTKEVTGQGEKAVQYNILKRDVDSSRQLYDTILQQMKESSVASALHASNVRVADPAQLPEKPVWPNFKILGALGFLAGLFSSVAIVTYRERIDRNLRQPGDVQLWTNLLELGTIPSLASVRTAKRYRTLSTPPNELGRPRSNGRYGPLKYQAPTVDLVTWKDGASIVAEAFRSALTSILFIGENGNSPRVSFLQVPDPAMAKPLWPAILPLPWQRLGGAY